jgi:hypothetical protein
VLGTAKDDRGTIFGDDLSARIRALIAWNLPEVVVSVARWLFAHDVVTNGVFGEFVDEQLDVRSHGC